MNIVTRRKMDNSRQLDTLEYFNEKCRRRITVRSDMGQDECIYIVPEFVTGMPIYDSTIITDQLMTNFTKSRFYCRRIDNAIIYINWSPAGLDSVKKTLPKRKNSKKRIKEKYGLI